MTALKDEEYSPNTTETPLRPCVQAKRQSSVCSKPLQMDEIGEVPTGPVRETRHKDCRGLVALGIRTSLFANICAAPCTAILIPNSCQAATQFTGLCCNQRGLASLALQLPNTTFIFKEEYPGVFLHPFLGQLSTRNSVPAPLKSLQVTVPTDCQVCKIFTFFHSKNSGSVCHQN